VVYLDRRKLTAPVLAQAAAFVAVLAIGVLTGHSGGTPHSGPTRSIGATPHNSFTSPHVSVTSQGNSPTAQSTELTVLIDKVDGFGLTMPSVAVEVLEDDRALTPVASTSVNPSVAGTSMEQMESVPAGHTYQVCVQQPPQDWMFTDHNTDAVPGWDCTTVEAGPQAETVTFHLKHRSTNPGTGQS
jgi:hypothetical protein